MHGFFKIFLFGLLALPAFIFAVQSPPCENTPITHSIYDLWFTAAREGQLSFIQQTLTSPQHFDINAANTQGETALILAASFGHIAIVRYLLTQGADTTAVNRVGRTALVEAARAGYTGIVRALLTTYAAAPNPVNMDHGDAEQRTALMYAAENGHTYVVELLLQANANVELADENGITALAFATRQGHAFIVNLLLNPPNHFIPMGGGCRFFLDR